MKLTTEKAFLVRKDTEKINDNQHSYHVMEHSKGQGYDYQDDIYLSYKDAPEIATEDLSNDFYDYQDDIYPSYEDVPEIATEDTSDDIYISYEVSRTFISLFLFPISVVLIVRADTA